jgi:hypothetical protein
MRYGHREERTLQRGRHPVALIERTSSVDRQGEGVRDALKEIGVVFIECAWLPRGSVKDANHPTAYPDRDSDVRSSFLQGAADHVFGGQLADDERAPGGGDPARCTGAERDDGVVGLLFGTDPPSCQQLLAVFRQQEEGGAVGQDRIAHDRQHPPHQLVEPGCRVRRIAHRLELPEAVLRMLRGRPRMALLLA